MSPGTGTCVRFATEGRRVPVLDRLKALYEPRSERGETLMTWVKHPISMQIE